jgi:hypothetical protein
MVPLKSGTAGYSKKNKNDWFPQIWNSRDFQKEQKMNGSAQIWNSRVFKKTKNEWFRSNLEQTGFSKKQK